MILLYHNVVPETAPPGYKYTRLALPLGVFKRHVNWLNDHFNIVPLDAYLHRREQFGKKGKNTIAITFDDGIASTFECVFPLLATKQIPVTFFVTTCHLEHGELIWGSYLNALSFESIYEEVRIEGQIFSLKTPKQCKQTRQALAALAIESNDPVLFCRHLAKVYPLPKSVNAFYEGMTFKQLQIAGMSNQIEIGAHTLTHLNLNKQPKDLQAQEILESKHRLTELTGRPVRYFAYPGGSYNQDTLEIVKTAGYEAAFATISRQIGTDPWFEIERTGIYSPSLPKLHAKAIGAATLARRFGLRVG